MWRGGGRHHLAGSVFTLNLEKCPVDVNNNSQSVVSSGRPTFSRQPISRFSRVIALPLRSS